MDHRQLKDPAAAVPRELLPHLHLVSKHRYPLLSNPSLETIVSYLEQAPKVMRETAVQWQFLDTPPDGSLFLTWQPTEYMNMNFASDGYIWADGEQPFNSDVRGYTLQMFYHRSGYKPQAENVATHARRRYRLLSTTQMGVGTPDPNLWLIHYSKATPENRHPAASLQTPPHVAQLFQARQIIQRSGQLPRKDFLLHDRAQWPVVSLPAGVGRSGSASGGSGHRRGASLDQQALIEEEEDVSRGDVLDFVTPREISRMRYEQHHEWMEEILESPYATKQIVPSELGLGKKGTLENFTNGFFTAPMSNAQDPVKGKVGHLEPGKADEFTKHANAKLAEMQADLEKMKQQHIKRMEKLRRTTDLGAAERKMRNMNPTDDGYKNIAAHVQNMTGKKIEVVHRVHQVSKGGQQDIKPIVRQPQYSTQQSVSVVQQQTQTQPQTHSQPSQQQQLQSHPPQQAQPQEQGQNQAQAQAQPALPPSTSQVQTQAQQQVPYSPPQPQPEQQQQAQPQIQDSAKSPSQPQPQPQPQSQSLPQSSQQSMTPAQPAEPVAASVPQPKSPLAFARQAPPTPNAEVKVENNDAVDNDDIDLDEFKQHGGPNDADRDDWDMMNDHPDEPPTGDTHGQDHELQSALPHSNQTLSTMKQHNQGGNSTPGNDFDMVTDFDANMDTAGDALADYGVDDDLNLDDSAFGDAFHHNDQDMS